MYLQSVYNVNDLINCMQDIVLQTSQTPETSTSQRRGSVIMKIARFYMSKSVDHLTKISYSQLGESFQN
jgi:hypothetical protein